MRLCARRTTCRCASWTCRPRTSWPQPTGAPAAGLREDPWARSPRSPATAMPSAGGRTWSSPAARAWTRSRRSPRRWARCARRSRTTTRARSGARPTCASRSARRARTARENVAVVCGAWHAPALGAPARPRPTSAPAGHAEGQGRDHVGAVDLRAARARVRLRRGRRLSRLVRPALRRRRGTRAALAGARPRCCATEGLDASAAQVVDATRLAVALAGIRDRRSPGWTSCSTRPAPSCARLRVAAGARARGARGRAPAGRGPRRRRRWSRSSRTSPSSSAGCG